MSIVVTSNEAVREEVKAAKSAEASAKAEEKTEKTSEVVEAKADTAETTEASETSETGEGETDADNVDSSDDESGEDTEQKPAKKPGSLARRFRKINAKLAAKDAEIEHWRNQALNREKAAEPVGEKESQSTANTGRPKEDDFATHAEYVEALTDWKLDQRMAKAEEQKREAELKNQHKTIVQTYAEREKAFAEKTPDHEEVMDSVEDVRLSMALKTILLESENGPELAYNLAKNRKELDRINALPYGACARAIGAFETSLSQPKKVEAKTTNAPAPISTVGSGTKAPPLTLEEAAKKGAAEYQRVRMEQMKKKQSSWG